MPFTFGGIAFGAHLSAVIALDAASWASGRAWRCDTSREAWPYRGVGPSPISVALAVVFVVLIITSISSTKVTVVLVALGALVALQGPVVALVVDFRRH